VETPSVRATGLRGRKLFLSSPPTNVKVKAKGPVTRPSTKHGSIVDKVSVISPIQRKGKHVPIKEHIEIVDITNPPENPTFKRINRYLKEARNEISKLKREELVENKKLSYLMDMCHGTLEKDKFIAKIF
jgi:hypothetical protein